MIATGNFDKLLLNQALADVEITYDYSLPAPKLGSLGDQIWFDANANGKQDDDEHGVANLSVKLLDSAGTVLKTDHHRRRRLLPVRRPARRQLPRPVQQADRLCLHAEGPGRERRHRQRRGRQRPQPARRPRPGRGPHRRRRRPRRHPLPRRPRLEGPRQGRPAGLLRARRAERERPPARRDGNVIADTKTDACGNYKFSNLAPGDYTVDFDAPAGYGFTKQFANANYKQWDSNADPLTGKATVTLASSDMTIDAGLIGAYKIGDTVWLDCDGDGKYEPEVGEQGIKCVKVFLIGDTNGDGWPDVYASTTTDANGQYKFLGLMPGNYAVTVNAYDLPRNVDPDLRPRRHRHQARRHRPDHHGGSPGLRLRLQALPRTTAAAATAGGTATRPSGPATRSGSAASATARPRSAPGSRRTTAATSRSACTSGSARPS